MSDHHPREIREAFLTTLNPSPKTKSRKPARYEDKDKLASLALAKAATALPGDYAVMSNIMRELRVRLGKGWLRDKEGDVMEISSSHGPGLWSVFPPITIGYGLTSRALREGGDGDKDMRLVHTSRNGLELSKRLFEERAVDSEDVLEEEELPSGKMSYERKLTLNQQDKVRHFSFLHL